MVAQQDDRFSARGDLNRPRHHALGIELGLQGSEPPTAFGPQPQAHPVTAFVHDETGCGQVAQHPTGEPRRMGPGKDPQCPDRIGPGHRHAPGLDMVPEPGRSRGAEREQLVARLQGTGSGAGQDIA